MTAPVPSAEAVSLLAQAMGKIAEYGAARFCEGKYPQAPGGVAEPLFAALESFLRQHLSADAALPSEAAKPVASSEQGLAIPEGWVLVPKEPTPEMVWAGNSRMAYVNSTAAAVWRTMVAVATGQSTDTTASNAPASTGAAGNGSVSGKGLRR